MYARRCCCLDPPVLVDGARPCCRESIIIAFIIVFNFCVFFVHYEVFAGLWGVVGERDPFAVARNRSQSPYVFVART